MIWKCPRCKRTGEPSDAREYWEQGDRDRPGYYEDACRICAPSEIDRDQARDAADEQRFQEERGQ